MALTKSVSEIIAEDTSGLLGVHATWVRVPLRQVATVFNGFPFESELFSTDSGSPLIRIRNVLEGATQTYYRGEVDEQFVVQRGELLIGMDGDFHSARWKGEPALLNQRVCKISVDERFYNPKLLQYALPGYLAAINQATSAITVKHLSSRTIEDINLPLPSRGEQERIVEKLEELLSDLDAGVAELKVAQRKLAQYRQSLLKAAMDGVATTPLGELATSIGQGWSPRCDKESSDKVDEWAVIKTTAIQPLAFNGAHNKKLPTNLVPREHLELQVGDLLVTRAGPRSRVGITCLVKVARPRLILCDKAYRIRCDEAKIYPAFLELVLNTPHIVNRIDELKTGISDSGLNLTQDRFSTLMIPIPSLAEQLRLVEQLTNQAQSIADQEQAIEHALKQSAAQRKNILKAAFAGQLVRQDPDDEPAGVLLARVHAERASHGESGKKQSRTARTTE
jgi:restriction endonuclease S subunit